MDELLLLVFLMREKIAVVRFLEEQPTLSAMGMSKDQIESTVRLSFCEENTIEEADYFLETMKTLVPMLRRYSRK